MKNVISQVKAFSSSPYTKHSFSFQFDKDLSFWESLYQFRADKFEISQLGHMSKLIIKHIILMNKPILNFNRKNKRTF